MENLNSSMKIHGGASLMESPSQFKPVSDIPSSQLHHHYAYEKTIAFPDTNASARGSDVNVDLGNLSELQQLDGHSSSWRIGGSPTHPHHPHEHDHDPSVMDFNNDIPLNLKIEEWLQERESEQPYPNYLSLKKHFIRIINTLNYDEIVLEVGNYMTVNDVLKFYQEHNSNCREYVWKDIWGNTLQMNKSLGENGLTDNSAVIDEIGLDHFPTILLYFKDGFENEPPLKLDISQPEPTGLNAPCRNY